MRVVAVIKSITETPFWIDYGDIVVYLSTPSSAL